MKSKWTVCQCCKQARAEMTQAMTISSRGARTVNDGADEARRARRLRNHRADRVAQPVDLRC